MGPNPRPPIPEFFSAGVEGLPAGNFMSIAVKHVPICTQVWRVLTLDPVELGRLIEIIGRDATRLSEDQPGRVRA